MRRGKWTSRFVVVALLATVFIPVASAGAQLKKRDVVPERANFKRLLFENPNYFGNLEDSPFKAVKKLVANTKYEEIECVGFNPEFDRLEAVVLVKKNVGYGGGICTKGTPEFVRFYLSRDGITWEDQGVTSFTAHDIKAPMPLEYAATLRIKPSKSFCTFEKLPYVRAILSWNAPPPAAAPDWLPVWGQVHEGRIQIAAKKIYALKEVFKEAKWQPPKPYEKLLDLEKKMIVPKPVALSGVELHALYKDVKVQPHRYLFKEIQHATGPTMKALAPPAAGLQQLDLDWPKILEKLQKTDGDTRYEELKCIGFNPNLETLTALFTLKLPSGYSGDLCSAGSTEYVAFWVDWGGGWEHVGTPALTVYDLDKIPASGLQYAVHVPIKIAAHRQPCQDGPLTVKVRAILSWQSEPPSGNPNWVPRWGNRDETRVFIPPGTPPLAGRLTPEFYTVGGMSPNDIAPATGLANGPAVTAGFTAEDSPFGGKVYLGGKIHEAPDLDGLPPTAYAKYRVSVRQLPSGSWTPLNDDLKLKLIPWPGGIGSEYEVTLSAPDGWFTYMADHEGLNRTDINGDILAVWDTGSRTGRWQLRIDARQGATVYPGVQLVDVELDNTAPTAALAITSGGGNCADFAQGDMITGSYSGWDEHMGYVRLAVSPWQGGTGFTAPPATQSTPGWIKRLYPTVPTIGESGTWQVDTTGMPRCGYIVGIKTEDRTIVNSGHIGWERWASAGLCLRDSTVASANP